jgi:hypothetical protein
VRQSSKLLPLTRSNGQPGPVYECCKRASSLANNLQRNTEVIFLAPLFFDSAAEAQAPESVRKSKTLELGRG